MKTLIKVAFCCIVCIVYSNLSIARWREVGHAYYPGVSGKYTPADSTFLIYNSPYSNNWDTVYTLTLSSSDNKYYFTNRIYCNYDTKGYLLKEVEQFYDTGTNHWITRDSSDIINDSRGNALTTIFTGLDTNLILVNYTLRKMTYDGNNNMITDTECNWDSKATRWTYQQILVNTYDSRNNLIRKENLYYRGGIWLKNEVTVYSMNIANKPDSINTFAWDKSTSSLIPFERSIYTYDTAFNLQTYTNATWLTSPGNWINSGREIYTYNATLDSVTYEMENWDNSTGWIKTASILNVFDAKHNNICSIEKTWDNTKAAYVNYSRQGFAYNGDNLLVSDNANQWDTTLNTWIIDYEWDFLEYFYYEPYTGLNAIQSQKVQGDIKLYPNPAVNCLTIELHDSKPENVILGIYDMSGRLYKQWTEKVSENFHTIVSTSDLPNGNYILTIRGIGSKMAKQFSVVH